MKLTIGPVPQIANSPNYKWWAYIAIAVGMFVTVTDQSGVNIALPRIAEHFTADIPTVQWVSLSYVLSTSALLMPMGRLSDMLGRKLVFSLGFIVFICGAAAGGFAQSLNVIIISKVVQGIGASAISANGMAMVAEIFPDNERGKALGLYMTIIGVGAISGPILGGILVSSLGWRAIFFASVPVGALALTAATLVLKRRNVPRNPNSSKQGFDWGGALMSSGALISFLLGMTNAYRLGWTSPYIIGAFAASIVLTAAFLIWESRASYPMLDLKFFDNRVFSASVSARFLSFLAGTSIFFLMPFYLVQGLGYSASQAGLLMVPGPIGMAILGPISGRLSDKTGTRWLPVIGMTFMTSALLVFTQLSVNTPWWYVVIGMVLFGSGMGSFSSPNTSATMSSLGKEKYGIVTAFLNLTRTFANVSGVAIATTIVAITMGSFGFEPSLSAVTETGGESVRQAFVVGLSRAYMVGAVFAVAALVISLLRGESRSEPSKEPKASAVSSTSPSAAGSDD
jgi:EmrB/QacA subfamily drug resistance transporter